MREIKFRVWDSLERTWQHSKGHSTVAFNRDGLFFPYGTGYSNTNWPNRFVVQQFTGLKDKAGRDIYEGDIIKEWPDSEDKSKIIMSSEGIWWAANLDSESGMGQELYMYPKCLVVGNIFENTELLK
jgi:uncharacterized phage protein (TIGR01671 family)